MLPSAVVALYNSKAPFDGPAVTSGEAGTNVALGLDLHRALNVVKAVYNFATQGGAIGNITLNDDQGNAILFPLNAIIKRAYVFCTTAVTSGGSATISISTGQTAADTYAATLYSTNFTASAKFDGIESGTMANSVLVTTAAGVSPYITVAVAALTAGVFEVFFEYVLG